MTMSNYYEASSRWRTFRRCYVIFIFLFYSIFDNIEAFNVDLPSAVLYHGTSHSMFGFTVAEYKEDGKSWVLIGAPEAPDNAFSFDEPDYRGGSVYYCNVNENDRCSSMRFPGTISKFTSKTDYKGRQWLGATLVTSGNNGSVMACAPRYYWFGPSHNSTISREPVGTCYYSEKGFNFTEYSPCRIRNSYGHSKQGSCQAGFSAAISKDSNRFYLGAVGSYYWQGRLFSMHRILKLPYEFEDHDVVFDEAGRLVSRTIFGKPGFMATEEGPNTADDSYMGYSVTNLNFYNTGISGAAVGVPRADRLRGKVRILTWNMIDIKNLTGDQFAAYFGYSICTSDVDGDGSDDIIVGAPMYSDFKSQKEEYETGRVYVYYQGNQPCSQLNSTCGVERFSRFDFIDGEHSKGRFGLSVAALGDINQDGFGDFAVGAPYEGSFKDCRKSSHTGAVYIYHGGKNGIRKKYSQVIRAEEVSPFNIGASSLNAFGFSLSGGLDLDDNSYPDVVVGAYESDVVYLFRSRPVIQLAVSFSFLSNKKTIGLDERTCNLKNTNQWVPCVLLELCLQYDGVGVEKKIDLWYEIILDSKIARAPRMFFLNAEGAEGERLLRNNGIHLYKGTPLCRNMTTFIAPLAPNQDKLSSFEAQLKYGLVETTRKPGVLPSILNMDDETPLSRKDSISIKNNCGDDNICIPDLRMTINSNVDHYVLGSGHLLFNVSVVNEGEDSFGSTFKLKIPPGINYSRFNVTKTTPNVLIECYAPNFVNNFTITCDVGNPLPRGKMVNFTIILDPNLEVEESRFEFWASVNSSNSELSATMPDNERLIGIQIVEETSLLIESSSSPKEIYYNISQYEFENIETDIQAGPFLKHEYVIRNLGPSEVSEAIAVFYWPSRISTGEDLLYMLGEPETKGPIQCERLGTGITNYRHLSLKRKYKEYESGASQGSWQYNSEKSGSHSDGSSFTHTSSQSGKNTQQGSINVIQGTYNTDNIGTGDKGVLPTKNDGTFQVGVIGLNQPSNVGGGSYGQSGEHTYTYQQQFGQGGQSGGIYQGGQGGYSGGYQGSGYSGVAQSGQSGYSGVAQSGQSGYSGVVQSGQSGYSGVAQSGQSGYSGVAQSGQSGYSSSVQTGQSTYTGGIKGGYYGSYQGGSSGNTYQQNYGNQHNVGGFQGGVSEGNIHTGGGYQQVDQSYAIGGGRKNISNVHVSETTYVKSTDWDGGHPNTYEEVKWGTNDNGILRNGSYSNVHPGFGYENTNLNTDKKHFFSNENEATYYSHGGSGAGGIDIAGGSINRVYDANTGTWITTINEGVQRNDPDVKRRLNETGTIYRYKSENTQIVQPTKISPDPVSFTPDFTVSKNAKLHKAHGNLSLRSGDQDYENDEDETENDDDDAEDDDGYDEEESSKPRRRKTRQVDNGFPANSFCSSAECIKIECVIRRLSRNHEATVTFPTIVWVKTIQRIALFRPVQVGSYVEVNITKLPHIRAQVSNVTYTAEVLTNVTSLDFGKTAPDVIPLWVVVGSACLGALILMLLIYLLYKSGFFKRNRPPIMPERQPLNRNGQYHLGDECL